MKRAAGRRQIEPVISTLPGLVSCSGKRCYTTQADAARLAKRQRRQQHEHVTSYHCKHCRAWHIGSAQPKRPALEARRQRREARCEE